MSQPIQMRPWSSEMGGSDDPNHKTHWLRNRSRVLDHSRLLADLVDGGVPRGEGHPPFSRLTPCAGRILTSWEATMIAFRWRMIMPSRRAHPGKILWEEFMKPDGITVTELAGALDVPDTHIQAIIDQRCDICDKMAIRMAQHFNTSQLFWSQLQLACDQAGSQGKPYC